MKRWTLKNANGYLRRLDLIRLEGGGDEKDLKHTLVLMKSKKEQVVIEKYFALYIDILIDQNFIYSSWLSFVSSEDFFIRFRSVKAEGNFTSYWYKFEVIFFFVRPLKRTGSKNETFQWHLHPFTRNLEITWKKLIAYVETDIFIYLHTSY